MVRNVDYEDVDLTDSAVAARRQEEKDRRTELEKHRDYWLVDCDQHYYEPDDAFTRHIEPQYRELTIEVRRDQADGLGRLYRSGRRMKRVPGPLGERTLPPGALREYFKSEGRVKPPGKEFEIFGKDHPELMNDRAARLKILDSHEVEAALILPTLGVMAEMEYCADRDTDPEAWYAIMRAFNRWIEDDWTYGQDGRIFGAPLVSLYDPDLAVVELDRLIVAGAKAIILRAGPAYGRSPADPIFDPFWARVEEAKLVTAFHLGDSGYQDFFAREWGYGKDHYPAGSLGFERLTCMGDRYMSDTIAALIFGGLFGRFPGLRMAIIELGSVWLAPLLKKMDAIYRGGTRVKLPIDEKPSDIYRRHFWISPYYEDPWHDLIDLVGPDRVLMGSDYPHPEAVPEPLDILEEIGLFPPDVVRKTMRDNSAGLLGLK